MSRRTGKRRDNSADDDSGMSTAGKVALGVAAAAAGAAIGYFGSRLLSSWLSETEEEKKPVKCDASDSGDFSKDTKSKDDSAHKHDVSRSTARRENKHKDVGHPQISLYQQVLSYYQEYVDIPDEQMHAAQEVVDQVILAVRSQVQERNSFRSLSLKVGDLVSFGSVTEGLKVVRPDCFDVMIPVMVGAKCGAQEANVGDRNPGKFVITVTHDDSGEGRELCDEEDRLLSSKLLEVLQVVIGKAVDGTSSFRCVDEQLPLRRTAAICVAVNGHNITVRFVPFVIIDSCLFLPAVDPVCADQQSDVDGRLWVKSYVRQEKWSVDRFDSSVRGHLVALKLLKAIRLNHQEQFGCISSYHLKMLLFHILEDLPDSCDWDANAIVERLIDLITRLADALSEHNLPHYFEQNVNLLQDVPHELCINLAKFLEKKLAHSDIPCLLKRDY